MADYCEEATVACKQGYSLFLIGFGIHNQITNNRQNQKTKKNEGKHLVNAVIQ